MLFAYPQFSGVTKVEAPFLTLLQSPHCGVQSGSGTVQTPQRFRWIPNLQKSALYSTHCLKYLSLTLDIALPGVFLPPVQELPNHLFLHEGFGPDVASFEAVPYMHFHSKPLQHSSRVGQVGLVSGLACNWPARPSLTWYGGSAAQHWI